MMINSGSMLETLLRQRIIMLEDSLARISSTRKELRDNVDNVKNEVRACFGHHLSRLRLREQQILEKLDTVASAKDGILSQQQDQLHQALGACSQGLQWLQTACDDLKASKLSSADVIERRIEDILNKFSSLEIVPRETAHVLFETDNSLLRRTIGSFGLIKSSTVTRNCESLPCGLEDYEDGNYHHSLSHKTVHGTTKPINTIVVSRPKLSNDANDWLLKEALTCRAAVNEMPRQNLDSCEPCFQFSRSGRQNQIHNWLHQIKNLVENEPAVFENFEIGRKDLQKESEILDKDILFRSYFEKVLLSPDSQWLFGKSGLENIPAFRNGNVAHVAENGDDAISCSNSSFTSNSFSYINTNSVHAQKESEQSLFHHYADYWNKFLERLWTSSDSLWLLPCASSEEPVMICPTAMDDESDECQIVEKMEDEEASLTPPQVQETIAVKIPFLASSATTVPKHISSFNNANALPKNMTANGHAVLIAQNCQGHALNPNLNSDTRCTISGSLVGGYVLKSETLSSLNVNPNMNMNLTSNINSNVNGNMSPIAMDKETDLEQWLFRPATTTKIMDEPSNHRSDGNLLLEEKIGWRAMLEKVHGLGDEKWLRRPQPILKTKEEYSVANEMWANGYPKPVAPAT